jgi:peptide/nickel transport system permease protein
MTTQPTTLLETSQVAEGGARLAWRRFRRNRLALAGLAVVLTFVLICFAGLWSIPPTRPRPTWPASTSPQAGTTHSAPTRSVTTSSVG